MRRQRRPIGGAQFVECLPGKDASQSSVVRTAPAGAFRSATAARAAALSAEMTTESNEILSFPRTYAWEMTLLMTDGVTIS